MNGVALLLSIHLSFGSPCYAMKRSALSYFKPDKAAKKVKVDSQQRVPVMLPIEMYMYIKSEEHSQMFTSSASKYIDRNDVRLSPLKDPIYRREHFNALRGVFNQHQFSKGMRDIVFCVNVNERSYIRRAQYFPKTDYSKANIEVFCPRLELLSGNTSEPVMGDNNLYLCGRSFYNKNGHLTHSVEIKKVVDKATKHISSVENRSVREAVYIGKNTFLGLDTKGKLISFWLNEQNKLKCAKQKHFGRFVHIACDSSIQTASGYRPRIALLAKNGDFFEADLTCFEKPTLLYTRCIASSQDVCRLVYDEQTCSLIYNENHRWGHKQTWPAQFNVVYMCALAKQRYQEINSSKK